MIIVIANSKKWFCNDNLKKTLLQHTVYQVSSKDKLTFSYLKKINCDFIFFIHWHWLVPSSIVREFKCILFHTAPLPFGRGGSPIQNLILKGYKNSPVCALKMEEKIDSGPLLIKKSISLKGKLSEIFNRIETTIIYLIQQILIKNIKTKPQKGKVKTFRRLKDKNNEIPKNLPLDQFYDRIRMLDAEDYPDPYIKYGNKIIIFKNATYKKGKLFSQIEIKHKD